VKISAGYYRDMLLSQQLLPVMRDVSGDFVIFSHDNAPAHRARDTAISWAVNTRFDSSRFVAAE